MPYDRRNVLAFVQKLIDLDRKRPQEAVLIQFLCGLEAPVNLANFEIRQRIEGFNRLCDWEKGGILYELSTMVQKKTTALASYYWGQARLEERLEQVAKDEGRAAPRGAGEEPKAPAKD